MAETAANPVEHVLPAVPLRQWVLTLPFAPRSRVAYDGELLGRIGRLSSDSLLGFAGRSRSRPFRSAPPPPPQPTPSARATARTRARIE